MDMDKRVPEDWKAKMMDVQSEVGSFFNGLNKRFSNESECIDIIYDNCRRILAPVTKLVDKYVIPEISKNQSAAVSFRSEGNSAFKKRNLKYSFHLYTISLGHSSNGSIECAYAYANRSAVSFELRKIQDCITDIYLSLENGYPKKYRHKLYLRLAKCYMRLHRIPELKQTYVDLVESLKYGVFKQNPEQEKEHCRRTLREIEEILEVYTSEEYLSKRYERQEIKEEVPLPAYGAHENIPNASSALSLRKSKKLGRYIIAKQDIKAGDILFAEEPYCSILSRYTTVICAYCNVDDKILITPCENCFRALFCSTKCRDKAWEQYHRWECNGILVLDKQVSLAHLALRVLLKGAQDNFGNEETARDPENYYKPIFHLVTNFDKMVLDDIAAYAVTAVVYVYYLKTKTSFFDWYAKKSNMDQSLISRHLSTLFLRHLCQLQCNAHADEIKFSSGVVDHRSAIYPFTSLMNHSCDCNVMNEYLNKTIIIRAARDIKTGEEVTNSYGHSYRTEPRHLRQRALKEQYYFICKCNACTNPELEFYYELHNALRCPCCAGKVIGIKHTRYRCIRCRYLLPEDSPLIKDYDSIWKIDKNFTKSADGILKTLALLKEYAHDDHDKVLEMHRRLYRIYERQGLFNESVTAARRYLQMFIKRHGLESHLTALRMVEVSKIMIIRLQLMENSQSYEFSSFSMETIRLGDQAIERLSVFYGPWNPLVKDIKERILVAKALRESFTSRSRS